VKWKKPIFVLSLTFNVLALTAALFITVPILRYYRPLHRSWQWRVKASTHAGESVPVKTYKMLGRSVFFFRVGGDDVPIGRGNPRWFAMDTTVTNGVDVYHSDPGTSPILYYPADTGGYGIDILDGKYEEFCYLTYRRNYIGKSVVFSNHLFSVSAKQRVLGLKTVEVHESTRYLR